MLDNYFPFINLIYKDHLFFILSWKTLGSAVLQAQWPKAIYIIQQWVGSKIIWYFMCYCQSTVQQMPLHQLNCTSHWFVFSCSFYVSGHRRVCIWACYNTSWIVFQTQIITRHHLYGFDSARSFVPRMSKR